MLGLALSLYFFVFPMGSTTAVPVTPLQATIYTKNLSPSTRKNCIEAWRWKGRGNGRKQQVSVPWKKSTTPRDAQLAQEAYPLYIKINHPKIWNVWYLCEFFFVFLFWFHVRDLSLREGRHQHRVPLRHASRLLEQVTKVDNAVESQATDVDAWLSAGVGDLRSGRDSRGRRRRGRASCGRCRGGCGAGDRGKRC